MKSKLKKIGMIALFLVGGGTSFMGDSINNKAHATTYTVNCRVYREQCTGWFAGNRDRCMGQGNSLICLCGQEPSVCY